MLAIDFLPISLLHCLLIFGKFPPFSLLSSQSVIPQRQQEVTTAISLIYHLEYSNKLITFLNYVVRYRHASVPGTKKKKKSVMSLISLGGFWVLCLQLKSYALNLKFKKNKSLKNVKVPFSGQSCFESHTPYHHCSLTDKLGIS